MNKALYILQYIESVPNGQWDEHLAYKQGKKALSVEAENYDDACELARKRLPKEKGMVRSYSSYGFSSQGEINHKHAFKLLDCLDQQHASYIPNSQEINVDNSSYSSSVAVNKNSIF